MIYNNSNFSPANLLIVDDHPIYRHGLKSVLKTIKFVSSVNEATNGLEAIDLLEKYNIDIVFMDMRMPIQDGISTTLECIRRFKCKIIGLSMSEEEFYILKMVELGAAGYLLKSSDKEEIELAIKTVLKGNKYFSPEVSSVITSCLFDKKNSILSSEDQMEIKKEKFRDVLYLICHEFTNFQIGSVLFLSHRSIEYYRRKISLISRAKNMVGMVKFAIKNGILQDPNLKSKWSKILDSKEELKH